MLLGLFYGESLPVHDFVFDGDYDRCHPRFDHVLTDLAWFAIDEDQRLYPYRDYSQNSVADSDL